MIGKIVGTTLLLFIIYTFSINILQPRHTPQHQWQGNIIKAQTYLYDENPKPFVIVGSSLSSRLTMDSLPTMTNLSFSGMSIFDGLTIIAHKKHIPKIIFIEMNAVLRPADQQLNHSLFSPVPFYTKKLLPSLREDKQPLGIIGYYLYRTVTKPLMDNLTTPERKSITNLSAKDLFQEMLQDQVNQYSSIPDKKELLERFNELQSVLTSLESKGTHIVFFEMPVNEQLCTLPKAQVIRENFYHYFSPKTYAYIVQPSCAEYKTTDGLHLTALEASRYTSYFKSQVHKYLSE